MSAKPTGPTREELARELLRYKMMEYSEDGFCATWLEDLEWDLWSNMERSDSSPAGQYAAAVSRECRQLAEISGSWWVYEDETCPGETGPVFVSTDRWMRLLAQK